MARTIEHFGLKTRANKRDLTFTQLTRFAPLVQVQLLKALSGPWRAPQKNQAGFDAGIMRETANRNRYRHRFPSHVLGQIGNHGGQSDAVQSANI